MPSNEPPAIGPRIRTQRKSRKLTLEALSHQSGVSRSMLSEIERGEANPTYATLWNLTRALGIELGTLLEGSNTVQRPGIDHQAAHMTPVVRSSDGSCTLQILSPPSTVSTVEWYLLQFDPRGQLVSDPHAAGMVEHLYCRQGSLLIRSADLESRLHEGESARYRADVAHSVTNLLEKPAEAFLVMIASAMPAFGR